MDRYRVMKCTTIVLFLLRTERKPSLCLSSTRGELNLSRLPDTFRSEQK